MAPIEGSEGQYLLDPRYILSRGHRVGTGVLSFIAFVCQVAAFFTPGWRVIQQPDSIQIWEGLWYRCNGHGNTNHLQCGTSNIGAYEPWMLGAFIFEILATLFCILMTVSIVTRVCRSIPVIPLYLVVVLAGVAGCCSIVGVSIYGARQGDSQTSSTLSFSFGLGICGAVFEVMLVLIGLCTYKEVKEDPVNPETEYTRL